jgi:hypothetical protein
LQDVSAALAHQNPKVKENTLIWLAGCVPRETKAAAVKLVAGVVPAATKCTDEGAPSIREAAFNFLVQLALKVSCARAEVLPAVMAAPDVLPWSCCRQQQCCWHLTVCSCRASSRLRWPCSTGCCRAAHVLDVQP